SMNRTGRCLASAQRMACHSGENTANGKKLALLGSSCACTRSATGGVMADEEANRIMSSASGGPSISTMEGSAASSAASTARAEPGPWWRMPSKCRRSGRCAATSHHFADRTIEVCPGFALAHHRFEVFLQNDLVLHRILDNGTDQIGRHALRIDLAGAEMAGLRPRADRDRDGLGRRQRTRG